MKTIITAALIFGLFIHSWPQNRAIYGADGAWPLSISLQEATGFSPWSFICTIFTVTEVYAQEIKNKSTDQTQNADATAIDVLTYAGKSERTKKDKIGKGMEIVSMEGLNIVVPKGAKVTKEGNKIFFEDTGEYLARRFDEMEKRFRDIEAKQEEIKKEIKEMKKSVYKESQLLE
jgi:hypothetical protein